MDPALDPTLDPAQLARAIREQKARLKELEEQVKKAKEAAEKAAARKAAIERQSECRLCTICSTRWCAEGREQQP